MNKFTDLEKAEIYDALKIKLSEEIKLEELRQNDSRFDSGMVLLYTLTLKWIDAFMDDYLTVVKPREQE